MTILIFYEERKHARRFARCPQGVDPAFGIQLLKRTLVLNSISFGKKISSAAQVKLLADVVKALDEFALPLRTM